jgi:hypothetical protein
MFKLPGAVEPCAAPWGRGEGGYHRPLQPSKERNFQLLKGSGWFEIPVVYNNNRRAILAMEKGPPGERAFADALRRGRSEKLPCTALGVCRG